MKHPLKIAILASIIILVFSCKNEAEKAVSPSKETKEETSTRFNKMLDTYYLKGLSLNPLNATAAGDHRYNDVFVNFLTDKNIALAKDYYREFKENALQFDDSILSKSEKMSKDILLWECGMNLANHSFKKGQYMPIDQMWSVNLSFGQLASGAGAQPFKTVKDYENWLKRVDGYIDWMNSVEQNMKTGMTKGYVLPKSLIKKVIPQLKAMTTENIDEHLFFAPVKNFPNTFTEEQKKQFTDSYTTMVKGKIVPTYKKLHDFVAGEYLNAGRESSGINSIPRGRDYYKHQIKLYTTTNMTANEIHELGLSEVARIRTEMEKIKDQVGFKGDLKSFFDHVRNKKELMPFTEPQQVIDNFNTIHKTMKPQIEKLFDVKPKTAFEVRRTEAFRENSASAEYKSWFAGWY